MAVEVAHRNEDEGDNANEGSQSIEVAKAHKHGILTDDVGNLAESAHSAEQGTVGLRAEQGHLLAHRPLKEMAEESCT